MFPVIDLGDAAQESLEQLGTKEKFWITHAEFGKCLCKLTRPGTGEDWSEVIAAALASRLGLPHAQYFLATYAGRRAVITPTLVPESWEALILGNQVLVILDASYNVGATRFRQRAHTVELVLRTLDAITPLELPEGWPRPDPIRKASDLFAGYLALDAFIGNTDRHHENWALIASAPLEGLTRLSIAPTFDHASCLGRNEPEASKARRLSTRDANYSCEAYASRARSAFYRQSDDPRPMSCIEAFAEGLKCSPEAAQFWLDAVLAVERGELDILLSEVPSDRLSETSRRFAVELLVANQKMLKGLAV